MSQAELRFQSPAAAPESTPKTDHPPRRAAPPASTLLIEVRAGEWAECARETWERWLRDHGEREARLLAAIGPTLMTEAQAAVYALNHQVDVRSLSWEEWDASKRPGCPAADR